jgi:hypothetical protein
VEELPYKLMEESFELGKSDCFLVANSVDNTDEDN